MVMETYKQWVRANRDFVSSIESFAQTMTWFLPERFSASEIGPEAVAALVGLIAAFNQHIIENSPGPSRNVGQNLQGHFQHLSFGQDSRFPWSLCISAVKEVEVLIEVAAEHYVGKDEKWSFVAGTEAVKAFLRLILLHKSGYKMLIDGGATVNVDDAPRPPDMPSMHFSGHPEGGRMPTCWQTHPNYNSHSLEGRALRALHKFGEKARTEHLSWLSGEQEYTGTSSHLLESDNRSTLVSLWHEKRVTSWSFILGEVLLILRPLVYVLLIRRYGLGAWKPWLVSLAVDLTGTTIISRLTSPGLLRNGRGYSLSKVEKDEIKRRQLLWAFYVMRDPFFSKYTRHRLEYFEQLLKPVPVVGTLIAKAVELLVGVQTRYSYISAS